jgi:magnesium chelatase subunit D
MRRKATTTGIGGRYVRAVKARDAGNGHDVAVDATLRAAATRGGGAAAWPPNACDVRMKVRERIRRRLIVFVVDASDSMGAQRRMAAAKGAVLALLTPAYLRRDRVALVSFRDNGAVLLLPPTAGTALARERLCELPTGGGTPLAAGLIRAWRLIGSERRRDPGLRATLVLLSDGEANVPHDPWRGTLAEVLALAGRIRADRIETVAIDTRPGRPRTGPLHRIAARLGAGYHHIEDLRPAAIVKAVE